MAVIQDTLKLNDKVSSTLDKIGKKSLENDKRMDKLRATLDRMSASTQAFKRQLDQATAKTRVVSINSSAVDKARMKIKKLNQNLTKLSDGKIGVEVVEKRSLKDRMGSAKSLIGNKLKSARYKIEGIEKAIKQARDINKLLDKNYRVKFTGLESFKKKVFNFAKKPINLVFNATGKALAFMKTGLLAAGAGGVAGGVTAMKMGANLERQKISMTHFLGGDQAKADDYLAKLRDNANRTPFETGEVVQAGTRALQVAEGDTSKAFDLVKIAEDMAALTPGKSVNDAIEALADAQMGEMERLKEFGFKGNKELFDQAGGDLTKMKSTSGKTLDELFKGGAEKLSGSADGKMSTVIGKLKSGIQDAGYKLVTAFAPALDQVVPLMDVLSTRLSALADGAIPVVIQTVQNVGEFLSRAWAIVEAPMKRLGEAVMPVVNSIFEVLSHVVDAFAKPAFEVMATIIDNVITPTFKVLGAVLDALHPVIDVVAWVFDNALRPVIELLAGLFKGLAGAVEGVINFFGKLGGGIIDGIGGVIDSIGSFFNGGHANGTLSYPGGWTAINERGPELVQLPQGTKIFPTGYSKDYLNRQGSQNKVENNVNVNVNLTTGGDMDPDKVADVVAYKILQVLPNKG